MKLLPAHIPGTSRKMPNISRLYMRMKSRITVFFVLLVILPSIIAASAIYIHTRSLIEEKIHEASLLIISKENDYISSRLKELELSVDSFVSSLSGQDINYLVLLRQNYRSDTDILENAAARYLSAVQLKALSAVYIIDGSGVIASFGPDAEQAVISDPSSQEWFSDALENKDRALVLGTVQRFYEQGVDKLVLSIARSIESGNAQAVVLFDFDHSLITDYLEIQSNNSSDGLTDPGSGRIITNDDGVILYSSDRGKITTKAPEQLLNAVSEEDSGFGKISYNSGKYYLTYIRYPELSWTFMDLVPAPGATGRLWLRSPLLVTVLAVFILILLVFLYILLRQLRPINELTAVISDYESHFGNGVHAPLLQIKNSDSQVSSTSDIDMLIDKISRIKLRQKEAELNSLQNQINPHFLYNTLESIRGAALYHGIPEIASMAKSLSLLFRYSISDRVLVSVREELQHLENYISIQNFRFENKFELQYSIPPELMDYKILKLTLQPLIENSIKHGLEMKLGKGTIRIEMLSLNSNIRIIISDDGLGMPSKKLEELNKEIANDKSIYAGGGKHSGTGIGVMNVNSRIKLYFGEQYGLKFKEAPVGTTVEITLPAVTENQGEDRYAENDNRR